MGCRNRRILIGGEDVSTTGQALSGNISVSIVEIFGQLLFADDRLLRLIAFDPLQSFI